MPARLPSAGQVGVHSQRPPTQRPFAPQLLPPQSQVFMHFPLLQTLPTAQATPAHGSARHLPLTHTCLSGHTTPAQALGAAQPKLHAKPAAQVAPHALRATHLPVPASQN
jgi:hypothetical protein